MSTELLRWQALADKRITPIENLKTRIRSIREDQQFPTWKATYDANPQDYLAHDARREYFVSLRVILQNFKTPRSVSSASGTISQVRTGGAPMLASYRIGRTSGLA